MSKQEYLNCISNDKKIISALAIDQRGALKKMLNKYLATPIPDSKMGEIVSEFKSLISEELTPYCSSILLDPEYGIGASRARSDNSGLILAYEKTGYDSKTEGRLPDSLENWSVKRLKEAGAEAIKFLLYYDADENDGINDRKKAYIERIGAECDSEEVPFLLEILSYDANILDEKSREYAKVKPHKVISAMREFANKRYGVDVLKVEIPVNMEYVEGFSKNDLNIVYSKEDASEFFAIQSSITDIPYIYLSAGVSSKLFQDTLVFAHESGATFNGVLCGRATWSDCVKVFVEQGNTAAREWCRTVGYKNISNLNNVLYQTATPLNK